MRIHGRSSGKVLSFKQETEKIQINSHKNACRKCSAFWLCALLTFIKLGLLRLPLRQLSSLFVLPGFALVFHRCALSNQVTLNKLFDANKSSQDSDEREEHELWIPSELRTNCLLIDRFQL